MFFRTPRFIRRFIRNRMHPMAEHKADDVKSKLSMVYAFIAWNAGGFVLYQIYKGNAHWPTTAGIRSPEEDTARPAYQWARSLGITKADVVRVSGLSISQKETINVPLEPDPEKIVAEGLAKS